MKVKILQEGFGTLNVGDIVECILHPPTYAVAVYDNIGTLWHLVYGVSCNVVIEEPKNSLKEIFGEMKEINVKF